MRQEKLLSGSEGYRRPSTRKASGVEGASQKVTLPGSPTRTAAREDAAPQLGWDEMMKHAWGPQGCAARPAKKIEGVEPHSITPWGLRCGTARRLVLAQQLGDVSDTTARLWQRLATV